MAETYDSNTTSFELTDSNDVYRGTNIDIEVMNIKRSVKIETRYEI